MSCGFRDKQSKFNDLGIKIIGVSFDGPVANKAWANKEGFKYELWSDLQKELAKYYGAGIAAGSERRLTVLLDATGQLILDYEVSEPAKNAQDVLEDCEKIFGN